MRRKEKKKKKCSFSPGIFFQNHPFHLKQTSLISKKENPIKIPARKAFQRRGGGDVFATDLTKGKERSRFKKKANEAGRGNSKKKWEHAGKKHRLTS